MTTSNLDRWHSFAKTQDPAALDALLHDNVTFHSPVVHTPQQGKAITTAYLMAAGKVFFSSDFTYVRSFDCGNRAVLEFQTVIDGISINGVDMIEWDGEGRITDFKVMVRPLKAIQMIHAKMAEMLAARQTG